MKDSSNKGEPTEPPKWDWEAALKTAILIGLSVEQFNYMTPYELSLHFEAFNENKEADLKERLSLVWMGEYYHRTKRMPSLKKELKKISSESKKQVMTDAQMLEIVKKLNTQFGGTVKKGGE